MLRDNIENRRYQSFIGLRREIDYIFRRLVSFRACARRVEVDKINTFLVEKNEQGISLRKWEFMFQ